MYPPGQREQWCRDVLKGKKTIPRIVLLLTGAKMMDGPEVADKY